MSQVDAAPAVPSPRSAAQLQARLAERVRGQVLAPGDVGYDAMRIVMSGEVDARPALIARPVDADDVAAVVGFARETGLPLAVRSGGHSGAGHSTCEGGLVLDLRDMTAIDIDPEAGTAWAQAGVTAGGFTAAAHEHGLAVGFGDTASVGLGGLVTGGGVGYLARKHGLTIDSLLAAEVVTADGVVRRVDADSEPELFWAIRGGGGNLGVVTRFQFRLQPVGEVVGGLLVLPATPETVAGFVAAAEAAPDELTTIANVMNCPPLPFVPAEHHGSLVVLGMLCFAGDRRRAAAALAPFRALGEPLADLLRPMSYPEMYPPEDPDYRPTAVARTMFVDEVGLGTARTIVEQLAASDAPLRAVQLRALGGAVARVPDDATAYAHRSRRVMVNVASFYVGADDREVRAQWVEGLGAALADGDDAAYVNFLADEPDRVRAAYPGPTWDRLAAVKATYDPGNLFRRNQNVPPA